MRKPMGAAAKTAEAQRARMLFPDDVPVISEIIEDIEIPQASTSRQPKNIIESTSQNVVLSCVQKIIDTLFKLSIISVCVKILFSVSG